MKYPSGILEKTLKIFLGTLSKKIHNYPTFLHNQGIFDGPWYNYIIPKVSYKKLNKEKVEDVIKEQGNLGKNLAYYVSRDFVLDYKKNIGELGYKDIGNDVYLVKDVKAHEEILLPSGYKLTTDYELEEVIEVLEKCFPDWPEVGLYTKLYEGYKEEGQPGRLFETFCITYEGKIVAAASVVLDKALDLACLHNDGVLPKHRRKGLHTALVQQRCEYSLENNVSDVLTIVEESGGSDKSYRNLSFESVDQFYLFSS